MRTYCAESPNPILYTLQSLTPTTIVPGYIAISSASGQIKFNGKYNNYPTVLEYRQLQITSQLKYKDGTINSTATQQFYATILNSTLTGSLKTSFSYYIPDPSLALDMKCINVRGALTPKIIVLIENGTDQLSAIDPIFTVDPLNSGVVDVQTDDLTKQGSYLFKVTCWWAEVPLYKYSFQTIVDVQSLCSKNIISSVQQSDPYYEVQDPKKSYQLLEWTLSIPQCKPFTYQLQLFGASPLPVFIKYDQKSHQLLIQTDNGQNEGFYMIVMKGFTRLYMVMPNIPIDTIFKVWIKCVPKALTPARNGDIKRTFYIGQPYPLEQAFMEFIISPICFKSQYYVIYSATLADGKPLPNFITFNEGQRKFTISSSSKMNPATFIVRVHGLTNEKNVYNYFDWTLTIQNQWTGEGRLEDKDYVQYIQLKPLLVQMQANTFMVVQSVQFMQQLPKQYYNFMADKDSVKSKNFTTFKQNKLHLNPSMYDSGRYQFYFYTKDQEQRDFIQSVVVEISGGYKNSKLIAYLTSISRTGLVKIKFSEDIRTYSNESVKINSNVLSLSIVSEDQRSIPYNFTWTTQGFSGNRILFLQLNFSDSSLVSFQDQETVLISFKQPKMFESSENQGSFIAFQFSIKQELPRQLYQENSDINLVEITNQISKKIDSIMEKNCMLNFGAAYIFNKLWRSIDVIQQVLMLSLTNVTVEGNIDVLFYVVQKYSNKALQCSDDAEEDNSASKYLKIIDTKRNLAPVTTNDNNGSFFVYQQSESFSKNFKEQGFDSFYMLKNIGPMIKNILKVLFATALISTVVFVIEYFKKDTFIGNFLRQKFLFNFSLKFFVDFGLRLFTFSWINLLHPGEFLHDTISTLSFIISIASILILMSICGYIFWVVFKTPLDKLPDTMDKNLFTSILFDKLKDNSRAALLFWAIFMIRRLIVSFIVVFLRDYQSMQLNVLVIEHFLMAGYILMVRPFESNTDNRQLMINEIISLSSTLHLFVFSDFYSFDPSFNGALRGPPLHIQAQMKHGASWSFIGHFFFIILFNLAVVLYTKLASLYKLLKKALLKVHKYCCKDKKAPKDINCPSQQVESKNTIVQDKLVTEEDRQYIKGLTSVSSAKKEKEKRVERTIKKQFEYNNNQQEEQKEVESYIEKIRREIEQGAINGNNQGTKYHQIGGILGMRNNNSRMHQYTPSTATMLPPTNDLHLVSFEEEKNHHLQYYDLDNNQNYQAQQNQLEELIEENGVWKSKQY